MLLFLRHSVEYDTFSLPYKRSAATYFNTRSLVESATAEKPRDARYYLE